MVMTALVMMQHIIENIKNKCFITTTTSLHSMLIIMLRLIINIVKQFLLVIKPILLREQN